MSKSHIYVPPEERTVMARSVTVRRGLGQVTPAPESLVVATPSDRQFPFVYVDGKIQHNKDYKFPPVQIVGDGSDDEELPDDEESELAVESDEEEPSATLLEVLERVDRATTALVMAIEALRDSQHLWPSDGERRETARMSRQELMASGVSAQQAVKLHRDPFDDPPPNKRPLAELRGN